MKSSGAKRVWGRLGALVGGGAAVGILALAGPAFACTASALLSVNPASIPVVGTATMQGEFFSANAASSPVVVRFNTFSGPVLWSGRPQANGTFSASFTLPQASPGYYILIATQTDATGKVVDGTPARAEFQIVAPPAQPQLAAPVAAPAPAPSSLSNATAAYATAPLAQPVSSPAAQPQPVATPGAQAQPTPSAVPSTQTAKAPTPAAQAQAALLAVTSTPVAEPVQSAAGPPPWMVTHVRHQPLSVASPVATTSAPPQSSSSGLPWALLGLGLTGLAVTGMAGATLVRSLPRRRARAARVRN